MAEDRRRAAERLEDLDLHRRVGDVVLAADDMGDAKVDVVDDGRQGVEIGAVLAPQHRIGQRGAVDMAFAAHQVVPAHASSLEPEAPVRPAALRLQRGAIVGRQAQRGAIVDRRPAERLLALAAAVELLGRLVGRDRAGPASRSSRPPRRRARMRSDWRAIEVGRDAEPGEIGFDRLGVFRAASARGRCRRSAG